MAVESAHNNNLMTYHPPSQNVNGKTSIQPKPMNAQMTPLLAAIGYSIIFLLLGGGVGGTILVFIIAKMLGI